ncbi:MAG: hypothetical protein QXL18_03370 [Candidatus Woesearchaeota archaeon]
MKIYSLGNRDIQFDIENKKILEKFGIVTNINNDDKKKLTIDKQTSEKNKDLSFKDNLKLLIKNRKELEKYFSFPMLEKIKNEKIVLIVTNSGHSQDTYELGEKIIKKHFNVIKIITINTDPRRIGDYIEYLEKEIKNIINEEGNEKTEVVAGAGHPHLRIALYIISFLLSLKVNEIRDNKITNDNFNMFVKKFVSDKLKDSLKKYDYVLFKELCKTYNITKFDELTDIILKRIDFKDFRKIKGLKNYKKYQGIEKTHFLKTTEYKSYESNFFELINNIILCLKKENYIDSISRLFALVDNLFQWYIKKHGINCNDPEFKNKIREKFHKYIEGDYLKKEFYNREINIIPNKYFLYGLVKLIEPEHAIIKFIDSKLTKNNNYYDEKGNFLTKRNQTIVAHGFKGISKQDIEEVCKIEELISALENLYEELFQKEFVFIYDEVNEFIKSKL